MRKVHCTRDDLFNIVAITDNEITLLRTVLHARAKYATS